MVWLCVSHTLSSISFLQEGRDEDFFHALIAPFLSLLLLVCSDTFALFAILLPDTGIRSLVCYWLFPRYWSFSQRLLRVTSAALLLTLSAGLIVHTFFITHLHFGDLTASPSRVSTMAGSGRYGGDGRYDDDPFDDYGNYRNDRGMRPTQPGDFDNMMRADVAYQTPHSKFDPRGWRLRTKILAGIGVVVVIVVIIVASVLGVRANRYPDYSKLNYTLQDTYQGTSFFDNFNYFFGYDPAQGFVQYVITFTLIFLRSII
jgi:hypothetical protein